MGGSGGTEDGRVEGGRQWLRCGQTINNPTDTKTLFTQRWRESYSACMTQVFKMIGRVHLYPLWISHSTQ